MPKNFSQDSMDQRLVNMIVDLQKQVRELRTNQTTWQGYFSIPVRSTDPPPAATGQYGLYYNSVSTKVRKSFSGGVWVDTTI